MKTFKAILVVPIEFTDIDGVGHAIEPGTQIQVEITEQPTVSTGLDGHSRIEGPGVITGEIDGKHFALDESDFERSGPIENVRDPLPVITKQGNRLRVHMRLIPGVLRDAKLCDQLIKVAMQMKKDLQAKRIVFDLVTDAFDLTGGDADPKGYVAV